MIPPLPHPTLPQAAVLGLVHGLIGGLALTALAAALFRLLGERVSAATRHAIWWGVLLAVAAMTVIPAVRPAVPAAVSPTVAAAADIAGKSGVPANARAAVIPCPPAPEPGAADRSASVPTPVRQSPASASTSSVSPIRAEAPAAARAVPPPRPLFRVALPDGLWIPAAFGLWIAVTAVRLVRLARDGAALARLKRTAAPFEFPNLAPLRRHLARKGLRRPLRLGVSGRIGVPLLAGLSRPRILIPEAMAGRLSDEELSGVVLHEAGHLRRCDDWAALAQHLLAALLWPLPAVAWISRRLALEQELACDAWVVTVTGARRPYAACLARLAELAAGGRAPLAAPGVIHPPKTITRRIAMLLDPHRTIRPRLSWLLLGLASGLLAAAVYQFGAAAPWIVLADTTPTAKAATAPQSKPAEAKPVAKPAPAAAPAPAAKPVEPKPVAKAKPAVPHAEAEAEARHARLEAAARRAEAEAERMERDFDRLGDELSAMLEKELAPLEEAMEKAAQELAQIHEGKMEALAEEMENLAESEKEGHKLTAEQEHRMQELQSQMEEMSERIQKMVQEKIEPLQQQIQEKIQATAPQRKEFIRQAIEQLQQELKRIEEEEKAAQRKPEAPAQPPK